MVPLELRSSMPRVSLRWLMAVIVTLAVLCSVLAPAARTGTIECWIALAVGVALLVPVWAYLGKWSRMKYLILLLVLGQLAVVWAIYCQIRVLAG